MRLSKTSPRPATSLPRVEARHRKRSQCGIVTVMSQIPSLYNRHLPHITKKNDLAVTRNHSKLWKTYEDMLNEQMRNEALIEKKETEIEDQIKEMENLLEQAQEERKDIEKVTIIHADALKMLNDTEVENTRVKVRQAEQELEVAQLEDSNRDKRKELRNLIDEITYVQNRIEGGPDYVKEETERFYREADEIEKENEAFDVEVRQKAAELNDLRIELIMKDSDSENDSDDENEFSCETNKQHEIPCSFDTNCVTPPLILPKPNLEQNTAKDLKLNLGNLNDQVILPPIRQRDPHENKPKPCQPVLMAHPVLPAINGVKINNSSTNTSELSRNILHRGTSAAVTRMAFLPIPLTSGLPAVAPRRRKIKMS